MATRLHQIELSHPSNNEQIGQLPSLLALRSVRYAHTPTTGLGRLYSVAVFLKII
jgi:hypothetical protein